jgi:hypothetical protein
MKTMCECGMMLDRPSSQSVESGARESGDRFMDSRCPDCGTGICRSCGIELGAETYCRWCATSLAARAA